MTMPPGDALNVAAELAKLRGEVLAGFAEIKGELRLIAQSGEATAAQVRDLDARVTALEARRWPFASVAALAAVVGAVAAVVAIWVGK